MLRAMECIRDLRISQAAVAADVGWSRTQISLSFRKGKLPVDAERFKSGVRRWAERTPPVMAWLGERGLPLDALFDQVGPDRREDLEVVILTAVGAITTAGPRTADVLSMARVALYLLAEFRRVYGDIDGTIEVENTAAGML